MKRLGFVLLLSLVCAAYGIQAFGQMSFSAAGIIESQSGGIKFPDGTVQTAAAPDLSVQVAELQALVATLQSELAATQGELVVTQENLAANTIADGVAHHDKFTNAEAIAAVGPHSPDLTSEVVANQTKLQFVMIVDGELNGLSGPHMILEGANVHVRSGSDSSGNLIVGYNLPSSWPDFTAIRTGRNSLVVGDGHTFTANGGVVVGYQNWVAGENTVVLGGEENVAEGFRSVVIGGYGNKANNAAVVLGGYTNDAQGINAAITGGYSNVASGDTAYVSGGQFNIASGRNSSVNGGDGKTAATDFCVVGDDGVDC
jgi:hypothetical protein